MTQQQEQRLQVWIASEDSPRLQDCQDPALRKSYVRTVADVWKVTEKRTSGKRRSNETAIPALPGMSKIFLAIIVIAIGTLIGLFVFAAFTL